jgi:hypothetical protein
MTREQYTDSEWNSKQTRLRRGTTFLSQVRKLAGWTTKNCRVSSNKGGPAVDGECTLHSETCYVHLEPRGFSYARKCKGMKDYSGERNHEIPKEAMLTPAAMVDWLKRAGLLR